MTQPIDPPRREYPLLAQRIVAARLAAGLKQTNASLELRHLTKIKTKTVAKQRRVGTEQHRQRGSRGIVSLQGHTSRSAE